MAGKDKLSVKEQRFVDAYLGSCNGNATASCRAAGYAGADKVLGIQGVRLLGKARIRAVINKRLAAASEKGIATAEERDKRLSEIMRMSTTELGPVIAAIRELNKCSGRHSIKVNLDVTERLSDIIAASRAPA